MLELSSSSYVFIDLDILKIYPEIYITSCSGVKVPLFFVASIKMKSTEIVQVILTSTSQILTFIRILWDAFIKGTF